MKKIVIIFFILFCFNKNIEANGDFISVKSQTNDSVKIEKFDIRKQFKSVISTDILFPFTLGYEQSISRRSTLKLYAQYFQYKYGESSFWGSTSPAGKQSWTILSTEHRTYYNLICRFISIENLFLGEFIKYCSSKGFDKYGNIYVLNDKDILIYAGICVGLKLKIKDKLFLEGLGFVQINQFTFKENSYFGGFNEFENLGIKLSIQYRLH